MNAATIVVLAAVIACVCLAIRSFRKKGMCGCKEGCSGCSHSSGCPSCSAAVDMSEAAARAAEREMPPRS
ncbi:MAG: FeoB-associated Cys-rich membrane protein [Slackia sp.]|nr:FeoB-associated Cys-rich membrane protein [Slackia sp.]